MAVIDIKQFGAKGDGVTNDANAIIRAVAAAHNGGIVYIPSGVYIVSFSGTNALSIPSNVTLQGESKRTTELVFSPQNTSFKNIFGSIGQGVTFTNLKMRVNWTTYGTDIVFMTMSSFLTIDNCIVGGGVLDNGVKPTYNAYFINAPSTTATTTDIVVKNSEFSGFTFVFLKPNNCRSIEHRIKILDNDFYGNYAEDVSFNSPNSICRDVIVRGNIFRDKRPFGSRLYCALSSIQTFQVVDNQFYGACADAIHMEENCQDGCVTGNIINVDGNGIITLAEKINTAGTFYMPQNIIMSNNTITKYGGRAHTGISLIWNGNMIEPGKRMVVNGNIIKGFDIGISTAAYTDSAVHITNNICHECNTGYFIARGYETLHSNKSSYCNFGIRNAESGGSAKNHTFIECNTNVSAFQGPFLLIDPLFHWKNIPQNNIFNMLPWHRGYANARITAFMPGAMRIDNIDAGFEKGFKKINVTNVANSNISLDIVDNAGNASVKFIRSDTANIAIKLIATWSGTFMLLP